MSREEGQSDASSRKDGEGGRREMVDGTDRGGAHKSIGVVIR